MPQVSAAHTSTHRSGFAFYALSNMLVLYGGMYMVPLPSDLSGTFTAGSLGDTWKAEIEFSDSGDAAVTWVELETANIVNRTMASTMLIGNTLVVVGGVVYLQGVQDMTHVLSLSVLCEPGTFSPNVLTHGCSACPVGS